MTFDTMTRLFPAAAALAEIEGTPLHRLEELLTGRKRVLLAFYRVLCCEDVLQRPVADTLTHLAQEFSDGALLFMKAVRVAGGELVCTVLYEYQPANVESLCFLLKRKQKDDFSLHYIADMLRILALSKLKKDKKLPTLAECQKDKPKHKEDTCTGAEILQGIIDALKIRKEERKHDN